jgi:hypothetical protein
VCVEKVGQIANGIGPASPQQTAALRRSIRRAKRKSHDRRHVSRTDCQHWFGFVCRTTGHHEYEWQRSYSELFRSSERTGHRDHFDQRQRRHEHWKCFNSDGVLAGDTTANRIVNSSDIAQTQSQSGQPVTASNFREDVTVNGEINSSDISFVQANSGTALP